MTVLLVAVGGAAGASLRYLIDRRVQRAHDSVFPWGTFLVNVLGSLILGMLAGLALFGSDPEPVRMLVGIGLCGSLTTYSTFGYETIRLFSERARLLAVVNVMVTVLTGFAAAATGLLIAALLTA
ncbi:MAG: fluoride efflux transporter CrcB [Pseudonocardiaceae bacterium]|nr:fluoride efflux transporter CrcB [Pseudonocardiaceae bacterium]